MQAEAPAVRKVGNVLGSVRAENDLLLDHAFVETAEFRSFAYSADFHVAVGRRGTGKSALYRKLNKFFERRRAEVIPVVDACTRARCNEHLAQAARRSAGSVPESIEPVEASP